MFHMLWPVAENVALALTTAAVAGSPAEQNIGKTAKIIKLVVRWEIRNFSNRRGAGEGFHGVLQFGFVVQTGQDLTGRCGCHWVTRCVVMQSHHQILHWW